MKYCDGTGKCFRRSTKYYFIKSENVYCAYKCKLLFCKRGGCYMKAPVWYFRQYKCGMCYECNIKFYKEYAYSIEADLRSDLTRT